MSAGIGEGWKKVREPRTPRNPDDKATKDKKAKTPNIGFYLKLLPQLRAGALSDEEIKNSIRDIEEYLLNDDNYDRESKNLQILVGLILQLYEVIGRKNKIGSEEKIENLKKILTKYRQTMVTL